MCGATHSSPRRFVVLALTALLGAAAPAVLPACVPTDGTSRPIGACETTGVICSVAGTGLRLFDGDGMPALETSFYFPLDIEFDESERPLILDFNNLRVRRINDDGTIETIMGMDFEAAPIDGALASETPLHHASDIEMDDLGQLYVAGDHVPVVFLVDRENRVRIVAGNGEFGNDGDGGPALAARMNAPFGVLPDDLGGFYISDSEAHVVRYVNPDGIITTVAGDGTRGFSGNGGPGPAAQLDNPTRMGLAADGTLYFCDTNNNAIRRVSRDGMIEAVAGTGALGYAGDGGPAVEAELNTPFDIRFAPDGTLYIADTGNNVIRRLNNDGTIETVIGTGEAGFGGDESDATDCLMDRPSGINFASDGSLWIADTYNQRVRRVKDFLNWEGR